MKDPLHLCCPHCGTLNRVPAARLGHAPRCGGCREPLFSGRPLALTTATFDLHVSRSDIPVLVDFWAPWCGPCRMMAPAFEEAAQRMEPGARFAKLNTDEAQEIAGRYGIRSIPTLIVFKGGREIARQPGAMGAEALVRWVSGALA